MAKKLLIVDDNQGCNDLYRMRFELAKWDVKSVFSAEEAIDLLSGDWIPDAILLDLMLPGMQGDEYLKKLKDDPKTKDVKVVLLTALSLNVTDDKDPKKLADDIILKIDILPEALVKRLEKLVE